MLTFDHLLGRNYLPSELPPGFVSTSFGRVAARLKQSWSQIARGERWSSRSARFNLARHGSLRRLLSIPNPVHQLGVADILCEHWQEIEARLDRPPSLSESRPVLRGEEGSLRLLRKRDLREQPELRAQARAGMRYVLRADIARFYPSIYTHCIEWAIHGKAASKQALSEGRSPGWGQRLDRAVRLGQDNETMGIPIGPVTSAIIAELVLSEVDQGLRAAGVPIRGFRYTDDYELAFARREEAEVALSALQGQLVDFRLDLNSKKTGIVSLPTSLDSPWSAHLKGMFFRPGAENQRRDLLRLFDIAVELSAKHPDEQVQKYALGILCNGVTADAGNWRLVEHWLMQCLVAEPGTAQKVLTELKRYDSLGQVGRRVDRAMLGETLKALIRDHIGPGHSSEVAWGLWGMVEFELPIDEVTGKRVVAMDDPIVALLALFCHHVAGIWPKTVGFESYEPYMTHDDLRGERWILAYEAMRRGWLPPATPRDALDQEPFFAEMERLGVAFIDESRQLQPDRQPMPPFWMGSGAQ